MSGRKSDRASRSKNVGSPTAGDDHVLKPKVDSLPINTSSRGGNAMVKTILKVEMHTVNLKKESVKLLVDTAKECLGENYKIQDPASYKDDGKSLSSEYWVDRGQLVVQEGIDYSVRMNRISDEEYEEIHKISILAKFGFHNTHCVEALKLTQGNVGIALDILLSRYFNRNLDFLSPNKLDTDNTFRKEMELRQLEEIDSMKSIYSDFKVRINRRVWELPLALDYIEALFGNRVTYVYKEEEEDWNAELNELEKPEMCRFFSKGHCKFSTNCKFSHNLISPAPQPQLEPEKKSFLLEFRLPQGSLYPSEPALVCLSTSISHVPIDACLQVTERLMEEARICAVNDEPCVFNVVQLLIQQPDVISDILLNRTKMFLNPTEPLVMNALEDQSEVGAALAISGPLQKLEYKPHVYTQLNMENLLREDVKLEREFKKRVKNDPKYKRFLRERRMLPAWNMKEVILQAIEENQVVVISGNTGCGKSTQIPQYILDEWLESSGPSNGRHLEIVCTQPRQLSAIGLAGRVADERSEKIGNVVGYQIRLESKTSSMTRLLFCTIGILLRRMENEPTLTSLTHIVVDEVHERSEDSDILLLILKEVIPQRPDLKVILMSATLDPKLFSKYFNGAPVLEIEGRTFPVDELFLEDVIERVGSSFDYECSPYRRVVKKKRQHSAEDKPPREMTLSNAPEQSAKIIPNPAVLDENLSDIQFNHRYKDFSPTTIDTLYHIDPDRINFDLIQSIILWIINGNHNYPRTGSILIFLPGIGEISTLHDILNDDPVISPRFGKFLLLPLHSSTSSEAQTTVFQETNSGVRKIVLSTNIAETSITIPDCVFVIDSGKMKEKRFDSNKNMESLDIVWISKANAMQRMGRAGRVTAGVCFHLFSRHRFQYQFMEQPIPELLRVPLEQQVLRIMILPLFKDCNPHQVLAKTIEAPTVRNITLAINRLINLGAIEKNYKLTALGVHLAVLPVDVRIGKIIILGASLGCIDPALTIAACLSYRTPFKAPFNQRETADVKKRKFTVENSDQLTILKAYKIWQRRSSLSREAGYSFAKNNYLSVQTLALLANIKHQFLELLASIGFADAFVGPRRHGIDLVEAWTSEEMNINNNNFKLLAAILCAALYPNIVKVLSPEKSYIGSSQGAIPRPPKPNELKFQTLDHTQVLVHPSSVNNAVTHYSSPYLVYQEKVKTSKVFIRDCSMVPLIALLLFSGCNLSVLLEQGDWVLALDDGATKVHVMKHEHAELLKIIRSEFMKVLEEKIKNPCLNIMADGRLKKVIDTVVYLITFE